MDSSPSFEIGTWMIFFRRLRLKRCARVRRDNDDDESTGTGQTRCVFDKLFIVQVVISV